MADAGKKLSSVPVRFDREEWAQEVERLDERSRPRIQAEKALREIEGGKVSLALRLCEGDGEGRTNLPGRAKLYVPLGTQGASLAPFGFVFQLAQDPDGGLVWTSLPSASVTPRTPQRGLSMSALTAACMAGFPDLVASW